jgi:hypothetical protein
MDYGGPKARHFLCLMTVSPWHFYLPYFCFQTEAIADAEKEKANTGFL